MTESNEGIWGAVFFVGAVVAVLGTALWVIAGRTF
jgi:hypothetical protein